MEGRAGGIIVASRKDSRGCNGVALDLQFSAEAVNGGKLGLYQGKIKAMLRPD